MFARRVSSELMLGLAFVIGLGLQLSAAQYAEFLDMGLDNPLSLIWHNRHQDEATVGTYNRFECTTNERNDRKGVCMKAAACRYQGGTSIGRSTCGVWNTCCIIERTSNQTSDQRVTYFVNPSNPRSRPQPQHVHVHLKPNTCQLRVDIVSMNLLVPTPLTDASLFERKCLRDYLTVEPQFEDNNIPDICGKQQNIHFYIQLDDRIHTSHHTHITGVTFSVYLDRTSTAEATWDIKITQLECPRGYRGIYDKQYSKDVSPMAGNDFYQLAPRGCLQYFTEPTGEFHNFGFASTTDTTLVTGQNYAICFKRHPGTCGLRLTPLHLTLRVSSIVTCMNEYIFVPEVLPIPPETTPAPMLCSFVENQVYRTNHPGPLYVRFFSAHPASAPATVAMDGFSFRYEVLQAEIYTFEEIEPCQTFHFQQLAPRDPKIGYANSEHTQCVLTLDILAACWRTSSSPQDQDQVES